MSPFSIFIPVYNEEDLLVGNTERLISYLDRLGAPYEVVIVSNGSTDRTEELGLELQRLRPMVKFAHIPHKGPGDALCAGLSLVSYNHVITVDMDLSVDLGFIEEADALLTLGYEVVVGSKRMGSQKRSLLRRFASNAYIISAIVLLGLSFDDYSLAAKGYDLGFLKQYASRLRGGTFYVVEFLYQASANNHRIVEIPVSCKDDRKSRFNLLHEGIYRFGMLFLLWLREKISRPSEK